MILNRGAFGRDQTQERRAQWVEGRSEQHKRKMLLESRAKGRSPRSKANKTNKQKKEEEERWEDTRDITQLFNIL